MSSHLHDPSRTAAVILAAGGSSRLGRPKQLIQHRGRSLLRRAAETALASVCRPVIVVLGHAAEDMRPELRDLDVQVVINPRWRRGIGTSIRTGVAIAAAEPHVAGVLLMLVDQPLIEPSMLDTLVCARRESGRWIAASAYDGTVGVPALFDRALFPSLLSLSDDEGAKRLVLRHIARTVQVAIPDAAVDLDTPSDLMLLSQHRG